MEDKFDGLSSYSSKPAMAGKVKVIVNREEVHLLFQSHVLLPIDWQKKKKLKRKVI